MNQRRPVRMNDKEWEAFSQFAIEHYREAARIAMAVRDAQPFGAAEDYNVALFAGILDKTASPLVYLKDAWRDLSPEERLAYYPKADREEAEARRQELSAKAAAQLEGE